MIDTIRKLYYDLFHVKDPQSYSRLSKIIHWVMAVIILLMISTGFFMVQMNFSPFKFEIYALHKSFGFLILLLVVFRLIARFTKPTPPPIKTHSVYEKFLSKAVHILLYMLMILIPVSGWLMSSAGDFPQQFFGLFEMPDLVEKNKEIFAFFRESHELFGFSILLIIGLHMAGAFKHEYIDGDETLRRMTKKNLSMVSLVYLTVLFVALWLGPWMILSKNPPQEEQLVVSNSLPNTKAPPSEKIVNAWDIIQDHSHIKFSADQYGTSFEGAFKTLSGQIIFDPEDLANSGVRIEVDLTSIQTGSSDRDQQALGHDWFFTDEFPKAIFESTEFIKTAPNHFLVTGKLTLRDQTQIISFPFTLDIEEKSEALKVAKMTAELSLNRLDYGVGQGQWEDGKAIGKIIELQITLSAEQKNAP